MKGSYSFLRDKTSDFISAIYNNQSVSTILAKVPKHFLSFQIIMSCQIHCYIFANHHGLIFQS